jgi:hypothetical protein
MEISGMVKIKDVLLDPKCRLMKQNLVLTGRGGRTKNEAAKSKLRDFLYYEIGIDSDIQFGNVHRFGEFTNEKKKNLSNRCQISLPQ